MKKTVIKRRKRVPAAAGGAGGSSPSVSGRMSDQAAAEALVSVGRVGLPTASGAATAEESEGEEQQQPKKKRARRSVRTRASAAAEKDDDDVDMDDGEESSSTRLTRKRSSNHVHGNGWTDERSGSPQHRGSPRVGATFPGGAPPGFELLPNGMAVAAALLSGQQFMRPGSNVPSRSHSPLNPAAAFPPTYLMPGGPYYAQTGELSSLMNLGMAAGVALNGFVGGVPTVAELERHYIELGEHKRKWEEMMEKTERMMATVKKTIDEMKGEGQAAAGSSTPAVAGSPSQKAATVPAPEPAQPEVASPVSVTVTMVDGEPGAPASVPLTRTLGAGEKKEPVWALTSEAAAAN